MISFEDGLLLFLAYSVIIIIVVLLTRKPHASSEDFLVMERKLGVFRGSLSIAVSWIWAPAVFICSAQAYTQGLPGIFWFTLPNIVTFFVFVPFALRMRKILPAGFTIGNIFKFKYPDSPLPHRASLVVAFGYQLGAIIINCVAGATLINLLSGVPYSLGVVMMGGLALTYSLISGLRASVISDVVQMLLILIIAFVIVPLAITSAGGMDIIKAGIGGESGNFSNLLDPHIAFTFGIATSIGLLAGPIADQMFSQRAFAAKEDAIVKIFVFGGITFGLVPIILSLLGFIGAGLAITNSEFVVADPQMVGPAVINFLLPKWLLMLFAFMAFAGLTSTLDSAFSAAGALWSVDVKNYQNNHNLKGVHNARVGMIIFAFIGVAVALLQPKLLWVFLIYGALAASLFFPMLITLFKENVSSKAVFWGIVVGIIAGTPLSIYANLNGNTNLLVGSSLAAIFLPALVILTLNSLATKSVLERKLDIDKPVL